ncbi:MAG TPA: glycosyltransferase [Marmoricola sp.]|nr:glycosyltransferase [Marmoricola sp.]
MMGASRADRPRLLIYSQDGLGLGHLRRTTLLASEYLAAHPDGAVLTLCDSPTGQFFRATPGHDYLKLPSIRKAGPGEWSPVSLPLPFSDVLALRKELIRAAAVSFEPDILLVDHMPHGATGELVPTLEALEPLPVKKILGLRDILDAPGTIRKRWSVEGAFEAVDRHFDEVLVYGSRDVFDVGDQYGWPDRLKERLHYCGYVCAPAPEPGRGEGVRRRFLDGHHADSSLIVAMAGGGADAFPLFDTLVRAFPAVASDRRCRLLVITGPFLPQDDVAALRLRARGLPIDIASTVADSMDCMAAADLVVTMAGYNTSAELLRVGAPALLVPRPGPSAEQQMRARRLADRGWVHCLSPAMLSVDGLAAAVIEALDQPPIPRSSAPDLLGLERATERLVRDVRAGRPVTLRPHGTNGSAPKRHVALLHDSR